MTPLVDPPTAPFTRIAFSNASRVRTLESRKSSRTISTMRRPAIWARTPRLESTAGIAALRGRATPSASTIDAIVEAVPIVIQWPALRDMQASASENSHIVICPARTASENCQTLVPDPIVCPLKRPFNIGPPDTTMLGRSEPSRDRLQDSLLHLIG